MQIASSYGTRSLARVSFAGADEEDMMWGEAALKCGTHLPKNRREPFPYWRCVNVILNNRQKSMFVALPSLSPTVKAVLLACSHGCERERPGLRALTWRILNRPVDAKATPQSPIIGCCDR